MSSIHMEILALKNKISWMKKVYLMGFISRLDRTEERLSEPECRPGGRNHPIWRKARKHCGSKWYLSDLKVVRQKPSPPGILDPVKVDSTEKSKDISPEGQLRESSCRTLQNKKWQRGSLRQRKMMPRGNVCLQEWTKSTGSGKYLGKEKTRIFSLSS